MRKPRYWSSGCDVELTEYRITVAAEFGNCTGIHYLNLCALCAEPLWRIADKRSECRSNLDPDFGRLIDSRLYSI